MRVAARRMYAALSSADHALVIGGHPQLSKSSVSGDGEAARWKADLLVKQGARSNGNGTHLISRGFLTTHHKLFALPKVGLGHRVNAISQANLSRTWDSSIMSPGKFESMN